MTTVYPGALDTLPRPLPTTLRNAPGLNLSGQIDNLADAIEALEAKLGTGATAAAAGRVLRATGAGASAWAALQTADIAANQVTQVVAAAVSTNGPQTTSTTAVLVPGMTISMTTQGGAVLLLWDMTASSTGVPTHSAYELYDASAALARREQRHVSADTPMMISQVHGMSPTAGVHVFELRWWIAAGVGPIVSTLMERAMVAIEFKR